jgi:hypothetical protein
MKHKWIAWNELECPVEGVLTVYIEGDQIVYDMGGTQVLVTDGRCPECGEKINYEAQVNFRNEDLEDFKLQLLKEGED